MGDSNDSDTPAPYRSDGVGHPDSKWFHSWRHELDGAIREFRGNFVSIDTRMHEGSMSLFKHDEQIKSLAKSQAASDTVTNALNTRLEALENKETTRAEREMIENSGIMNQIKTTVILTAVGSMVVGMLGFVWYLVSLYAVGMVAKGHP